MPQEVRLPKLKENVDTVEVAEVHVAPNDLVAKDQTLLTVTADKANLEVASPLAGRVTSVLAKVGTELHVGQPYCVIDGGDGASPAKQEPVGAPRAAAAVEVDDQKQAAKVAAAVAQVVPAAKSAPSPRNREGILPASPAARWLARKLGVDLYQVHGTGPHGRITEQDVKNHFQKPAGGLAGVQVPPLPDFARFGPVEAQDLTRVRRLTAKQMSLAWGLIPHVTQHDLADVSDLETFRKQQAQATGLKLTVTAFALKASAIVLQQFPSFNASLDLDAGKLILKRYYHIGVAVNTDAGLLVPVIRDVDKKSIEELAHELNETAERARQGKADLGGGSFTITNLGGFGGTGFTPIINYPEVAILGLSRARLEPVVRAGQMVPRLMLPLSLSYDHRVIDGAAAAQFTRRLAELLENPLLMLMRA